MQPTENQEIALTAIHHWFNNSPSRIFKLGGLAGTGKSALIPFITERLKLPSNRVQYVAPTNKAALVIQSKLMGSGLAANVRTVHKTYYLKTERHCDNCPLTNSQKNICHGVSGYNPCGCHLDFQAKMNEDRSIELVICDESSMINREVYEDLLAICPKILFIGDHGQLEAIEEDSSVIRAFGKFFLMDDPDYVLTNIHRQAEDSLILDLAYKARNGERIEYGDYSDVVKKVKINSELEISAEATDIIAITYFSNINRQNPMHKGRIAVNDLNRIWRANLGITNKHPIPGERIVCRDFIRSMSIAKGSLATIKEITVKDDESYYFTAILDDGREYSGLAAIEQFFNHKVIWGQRHLDKWDYGYALTCHTAQGSEFDSVVVFEPSRSFANWLGSDSYSRWLYTAITRAKRRLLLVE